MKLKHLLRTAIAATTLMLWSFGGWGQQLIGEFKYMNGGFEGQATGTLATSLSSSNWTRQSQAGASSSIIITDVRSGSQSASVTNVATASRGLQSPQSSVPSEGPTSSTAYVVQFYVKNASSVNGFQSGVTVNGTTNPTYSTAAILDANVDWFKKTFLLTTASNAVTSAGIGIVRSQLGNFLIDDFVIYAGSAVDETAPNSPGAITVNNPTHNSLDVSWVAADGGVDGGGYVVVRYATNPNADNDPNQNGIYAIGNTITNGTGSLEGTVRYIGTNTSFTDNIGLSAETQYWYKVYTVDKAFNYSDESSGTGTTVAAPAGFTVNFSVVSGNGTLIAEVDGSGISSGDNIATGKDVEFTASPNANYQVKEWTLNTVAVSGNTTNSFSIIDLQANSTVTVEFELIPVATSTGS